MLSAAMNATPAADDRGNKDIRDGAAGFRERYFFYRPNKECRSNGHEKCDAPRGPPLDVLRSESEMLRGGRLATPAPSKAVDTRPRDAQELARQPPRDGRACRDDADMGDLRPPLPDGRHHVPASPLAALNMFSESSRMKPIENLTLYTKSYPSMEPPKPYEA